MNSQFCLSILKINGKRKSFFFSNSRAYWLGLDKIHQLTKTGRWKISMSYSLDGDIFTHRQAWRDFRIADESNQYRLTIGKEMTLDGEWKISIVDMLKNRTTFSTPDRGTYQSRASGCEGGWWFSENLGCSGCFNCPPLKNTAIRIQKIED